MQEVIKDDSKPPFNKLLSHLEELMGKEKFGLWLADKYPHLESFEARKRRVWLDEFLYEKEVKFEFYALQQWRLLQDCEQEKIKLQKIACDYYLYILLFFLEVAQYEADCLRRLKLLQKLMMDKLEQLKQQLNSYLKKLADKILFIELMIARLYRILDRLEQAIKSKTEVLLQDYFKILSTLSGAHNPTIKKIQTELLSDLRKVTIGAKSIIDFHLGFRTQITVVKNSPFNFYDLESQFSQLNDNMHSLIEDRENREECLNFLEAVKEQRTQCINEEKQISQDLKLIEKSQAEVIYLTSHKPSNSYTAITALFEKALPIEIDYLLDPTPMDTATLEAIKESLSGIMALEEGEGEDNNVFSIDERNMAKQVQQAGVGQLAEKIT